MIKSKTKHHCNSDLRAVVGFNWFYIYIIVSQNFTRSANRPALLHIPVILVPLVETEPAKNITSVMELPEKKKFNPTTAYICV